MSYEIADDFLRHVTVEHVYHDGARRTEHVVGTRAAIVAKTTEMLDQGLKYANDWSVTITPIHPANVVELDD